MNTSTGSNNGNRSILEPEAWRTRTCRHCGPDECWSAADIHVQLSHFPGWAVSLPESSAAMATLQKTFIFKDFNSLEPVLIRLLAIARIQDHHPDVQFGYRNMTVAWSTHSAGGISENDWICAALLEETINTVSA